MKKIILLLVITCFLSSCNVTESIVFNKDMSGKYASSFDMSPMIEYANENRPASQEEPKKEKIDTTIVFDDFYKTHKDSIATLTDNQRARLEKLRGMTMDVHMDEENNIFEFKMAKPFLSIDDLKGINNQMDDAMGIAKNLENKENQATNQQFDVPTKIDEVIYTFTNNTFSRFHPVSENETETDIVTDEDTEETGGNDYDKQFESVFASSYYTLVYTFPRKVKSVSNKDAIISEDGKTITYKVPWNVINKDESIMNLNVVLEE